METFFFFDGAKGGGWGKGVGVELMCDTLRYIDFHFYYND